MRTIRRDSIKTWRSTLADQIFTCQAPYAAASWREEEEFWGPYAYYFISKVAYSLCLTCRTLTSTVRQELGIFSLQSS